MLCVALMDNRPKVKSSQVNIRVCRNSQKTAGGGLILITFLFSFKMKQTIKNKRLHTHTQQHREASAKLKQSLFLYITRLRNIY